MANKKISQITAGGIAALDSLIEIETAAGLSGYLLLSALRTLLGGLNWTTPPTSSTSAGTAGQIAYDANFFYICYATNSWKSLQFAPVPTFSTHTWVSDGDANGIFYFLGTVYGTAGWANPANISVIVLSASNLAFGALSAIVNRDASDTFDNPQASNWFKVDLGASNSASISKYSFRSRISGSTHPDGFTLQGSNNNSDWTDISTETGLSMTDNTWYSFTPPVTQTQKYRYFRLIRPAVSGYFTIGEWELYGSLAHV